MSNSIAVNLKPLNKEHTLLCFVWRLFFYEGFICVPTMPTILELDSAFVLQWRIVVQSLINIIIMCIYIKQLVRFFRVIAAILESMAKCIKSMGS
jgi:hypothetical protein